MAERLDPELRRRLRGDWADLAALLRTRGDPRGDDVLEFVQKGVECDPRIERGCAAAPYVLAAGEWWTIRCLANGVSAYLHPRTEQRARSERYGRIAMLSPFVPAVLQSDLRELASFEGREVTPAELEGLLAREVVTEKVVQEHFDTCLEGLITLQYGWEPRELENYDYIVNLEQWTETAAEYDAWLDSEPCLRECEVEGSYQLAGEISNPALPAWMEDLYRGNPGRFWWLMKGMVLHCPIRREAAGRVLNHLTGVGLIAPGTLPSLLKACFVNKKSGAAGCDREGRLEDSWSGRCYTSALRWAVEAEEPGWVVAHGTVLSEPADKRIEHAWCERDGLVVDLALPVGTRMVERGRYYRDLRPEVHRAYSAEDALLVAIKNRHDGPWAESGQLKG